MNFNRYLEIAQSLKDIDTGGKKHFSFIARKNRIMSIGINNEKKTDTIAKAHNFPYFYRHSELAAIKRFPDAPFFLKNCILINVRINKFGVPMMSKPCQYCLQAIKLFDFRKVFYTNKIGEFEELCYI